MPPASCVLYLESCILLIIMAMVLVLLPACAAVSADPQGGMQDPLRGILPLLEKKAGDASQALFVVNTDPSSFAATVHVVERRDGQWRSAMPPLPAVIGRKGFAPPGDKREGDGRTPSGIFPLGTAFGYEPSVETRMPYRQATYDDLWVDDPGAGDYNRWVRKGETKAASFEYMRRGDNQYKVGIVIEYNTHPVVKGYGSAIFVHVWRSQGEPTSGCVAMAEKDILAVLRWLDPAAKPVIVMGTDKRIKGFKGSRGQVENNLKSLDVPFVIPDLIRNPYFTKG